MEAAVDDDFVEVLAGDGGGFDRDVGDVLGTVEEGLGVLERFAGGELDGALGCETGELFHGLVDGDELGAFDETLAGFEVAVLAGDVDLAGKSALSEGVDCFACKGVVAAHDGVGRGYLIEVFVDEFVSEFGLPVVAVILERDVHIVFAADGVEAVHYLGNVVVGFGTHDLDDRAAVADVVAYRLGHLFADGFVVKRDVEVSARVSYESVVADDRDALALCFLEDVCERGRIGGDYYYRIYIYINEIFYL